MKSIIAILLLCCLIVPFSATYIRSRHIRRSIRREIKHKLISGVDKKELRTLKFSIDKAKSSLKWKHSREFEYEGNMYDIVEQETHGDTVFYHCWPDRKETRLNRQLNKLLSFAFGHNKERRNNNVKLIQFIKSLYCLEVSSDFFKNDFSISLKWPENRLHFSTVAIPPPVPPPEIA